MAKKSIKNRHGELYVTSRTRAGDNGKSLRCPKCDRAAKNHVYHFSWSALKCQNCGKMIEKGDWAVTQSGGYQNKKDIAFWQKRHDKWLKEHLKKYPSKTQKP